MELLKHVAKHHYKDKGETYDDKYEEEEFVKSKELNNQKDDDKVEEGCVFKEPKLDEKL